MPNDSCFILSKRNEIKHYYWIGCTKAKQVCASKLNKMPHKVNSQTVGRIAFRSTGQQLKYGSKTQ